MDGSENLVATLEGMPDDTEVLARLRKLSKSGKLAGYEAGGADGRLATFTAYGTPFDGCVDLTRSEDGLAFRLRMPRKLPLIFGVVLALTVWPGLPLTDAFLQGFGWYERLTSGAFQTWMWYVPLAAVPAPFALVGAMKKSRASAMAHAQETVERLRGVLSR